MSEKAILVTGGAGFIGSHLVERLLDEGRRVVVLDNFDDFYDPAIKRDNVRRASASDAYCLVEGDLRDEAAVAAALEAAPVDTVVHLAARAGVRPSIADPVLYSSVNLDGTSRLLEACRLKGVGRFIFGSSSSVYGNNPKVPFAESDPVDHPISPYAATKKAGEVLCHVYHHLYGMRVACLRFFTVYGPRQRPEMAIHKFTARIADGRPIDQYGDGSSARDYTYVSDIVAGIVRAIDRCSEYHVWNLGGSRTISLSALIDRIATRLGVEPDVHRLAGQPGDVERTWADISRASDELGWAPEIDIDRGLDAFLDWFRRRRAETAAGGGRS